MDIDRYESLLEKLRIGSPTETLDACESLILMWKEVPIEELLLLKNRFAKLGLDDREARLDEALMSIAERRPAPFTEIIMNPDHSLWSEAVEIVSMLGCMDHFELFLSLMPGCPTNRLADLVRAVGYYRDNRAAEGIAKCLNTHDENVFMEAVLALRRCGGREGLEKLREARNSRFGNELSLMLDTVIEEMEAEENCAEV